MTASSIPRPRTTQRQRLRIIGGEWRSRIIEFPAVDGLRPTGDRVRETLFNWLGQTLAGQSCLDLFAGSGALGFEAHSRGAARVVLVESNRAAFAALEANAAKLAASHAVLRYAEALDYLRGATDVFDIVFLDPPYAALTARTPWLTKLLASVRQRLNPDGMVYLEAPQELALLAPEWALLKQARAGQVHFGLLTPKDAA